MIAESCSCPISVRVPVSLSLSVCLSGKLEFMFALPCAISIGQRKRMFAIWWRFVKRIRPVRSDGFFPSFFSSICTKNLLSFRLFENWVKMKRARPFYIILMINFYWFVDVLFGCLFAAEASSSAEMSSSLMMLVDEMTSPKSRQLSSDEYAQLLEVAKSCVPDFRQGISDRMNVCNRSLSGEIRFDGPLGRTCSIFGSFSVFYFVGLQVSTLGEWNCEKDLIDERLSLSCYSICELL